jgi:hypothetical protein
MPQLVARNLACSAQRLQELSADLKILDDLYRTVVNAVPVDLINSYTFPVHSRLKAKNSTSAQGKS